MARRLSVFVMALLLLVGSGLLTAGPASASFCGHVWGSKERVVGDRPPGALLGVRVGRHRCFDRMVLDIATSEHGWLLAYADNRRPAVFPSAGGATLHVYAKTVGPQTLAARAVPVANVSGFRTFKRVLSIADYSTQIQLDVRARLPFRAFVLPGPGSKSRLVVDVAHRW